MVTAAAVKAPLIADAKVRVAIIRMIASARTT